MEYGSHCNLLVHRCVVSGAGKIAMHVLEKLLSCGAIPITISGTCKQLVIIASTSKCYSWNFRTSCNLNQYDVLDLTILTVFGYLLNLVLVFYIIWFIFKTWPRWGYGCRQSLSNYLLQVDQYLASCLSQFCVLRLSEPPKFIDGVDACSVSCALYCHDFQK